jgi:hypothetical protein
MASRVPTVLNDVTTIIPNLKPEAPIYGASGFLLGVLNFLN